MWSEMTQSELEALADRHAQRLGLGSRHEAFRKLDAGELRGTAAEAEFRALRRFIDGETGYEEGYQNGYRDACEGVSQCIRRMLDAMP